MRLEFACLVLVPAAFQITSRILSSMTVLMIFHPFFRALRHGLREMQSLLRADVTGQRRFIRIHDGLDHRRSGMRERLPQNALGVLGAVRS